MNRTIPIAYVFTIVAPVLMESWEPRSISRLKSFKTPKRKNETKKQLEWKKKNWQKQIKWVERIMESNKKKENEKTEV